MRNVSDDISRENRNTRVAFSIFPPNILPFMR